MATVVKKDTTMYNSLTGNNDVSERFNIKTPNIMQARYDEIVTKWSTYFAKRFELTGDPLLTPRKQRMIFKNQFKKGMVAVTGDKRDIFVVNSVTSTDTDGNIIKGSCTYAKKVKLADDAAIVELTHSNSAFLLWDEIYDCGVDLIRSLLHLAAEQIGAIRNNTMLGQIIMSTDRPEVVTALKQWNPIAKSSGSPMSYSGGSNIYKQNLFGGNNESLQASDVDLEQFRQTYDWLELKMAKMLGARTQMSEGDTDGGTGDNVQMQYVDASISTSIIEDYVKPSIQRFIDDYEELYGIELQLVDTVNTLEEEIEEVNVTNAGHADDLDDNEQEQEQVEDKEENNDDNDN